MNAESWEDRRSSDRVSDDSALTITGCLNDNASFTVNGSIRDISSGGISFFINARAERDQVLDLTLISTQIQGLVFRVKARILRVSPADSERYRFLVAAQFEDDFLQTAGENALDRMASELVKAVEHDEAMRSGSVEAHRTEQPARCDICGIPLGGGETSAKSINRTCCFDCHARLEQTAWTQEIQSLLNEVAH